MKIMLLVLAAGNLYIVTASLYNWKKYRNIYSIFALVGGVIAISSCILSYFGKLSFGYSVLIFTLSAFLMNWSSWKIFKDKQFFWHSILPILAPTGIFAFIIAGGEIGRAHV